MARIPGYTQDSVNLAPVSGGQLNAAAEGQQQLAGAIVQTAGQLAQTFQYVQQRKARVYSNASMAKLREHMSQTMIQARTDAGPGGENYTKGVMQQYDDFAKNLLENAPNQYAQEDLAVSVTDFRVSVLDDSSRYEATAAEAKTRFDVRDSAAIAANTLLTKPEYFEPTFADQLAAFAAITDSLTPAAELEERFQMANSLAVAAIQGEIRLDPATAHKKLESGYWDTYEWQGEETTLITADQKSNFLESAKRAAYKDNEVERYVMGERVRNHLVSVAETGVGVAGVNSDEIRRVFSNNGQDEAKGEIAVLGYGSDLKVAHKVFGIKQGLQLASPEDRASLLTKYKPTPGSQSFADDQKVYEQLVAWNDADRKQMLDDPAVWSDQQGDVSDMANEMGVQAAASVSLSLQDTGGVPAHKQKVLGNEQAKNIVAQMKTSEPADVLKSLAGYDSAYGNMFGKVAAELTEAGLDSKYVTAYTVSQYNPVVGHDLIAALGVNEAELRSDFTATKGVPWEGIEASAEILFQDLEKSQIRLNRNRIGVMQDTKALFVRAAALRYKGDPSKDVSTYMTEMYDQSIGKALDIRETYYLPTVAPNGIPIDTEARSSDLERVARDEKWIRSQNFKTSQGFTPQLVAEFAKWENTSDRNGLRLVVERPFGGRVPVLDSEGKEYIVTFDELTGTQLWGESPAKVLSPTKGLHREYDE